MLQWTGGSRKKVNASRKSTQSKQKQYFEQRRRQQQEAGSESQSDFLNNNKWDQNSEPRSLDILSFMNLASIAQNKNYSSTKENSISPQVEHKNNIPKLSTPAVIKKFCSSEANNVYNSKELNNDLPKMSPAMAVKKITVEYSNISNKSACAQGTSSFHETFGTQEAVPAFNSKEKMSDFENLPPSNNNLFKSKIPDLKQKKQIDSQTEVSVYDLLYVEDLKRSSVRKSGHESHVAFCVKGLGKVEAETPPQSPLPYQRIYPEPPQQATRRNKNKNIAFVEPLSFDSKFALDPVMRDINDFRDIRWSEGKGNFEGFLDEPIYEKEELHFENSNYHNSNFEIQNRRSKEVHFENSNYHNSKFEIQSLRRKEIQFEPSNYHNSNFEIQNLKSDFDSEPYGDIYDHDDEWKYERSWKGSYDKKICVNSPGEKYDQMWETNLFNSEGFYTSSPKNNRFEFDMLDSGFEEDHDFPSMRCGMKAKRRLDLNSAKARPSCSSVAFDWERNSPKLKRKSEFSAVFSPPAWSFKEEMNDLQESSLRSEEEEESCGSTKVNFNSQAPKLKETHTDHFPINFTSNFKTPKFDDLTSQTWEESKFTNFSRAKKQKTSFSKDDMFLDFTPSPKENLLDSFSGLKSYKITNKSSKSDTFEQRPSTSSIKIRAKVEDNSVLFNNLERENSTEKRESSVKNSTEKRESSVKETGSDVKEKRSNETQGLNCESEKLLDVNENLENNDEIINERALVLVPEPPLQIQTFGESFHNDDIALKTPDQSQIKSIESFHNDDIVLKTPDQSQLIEKCNSVEDDSDRTPPVPSKIENPEGEKGKQYQVMSYVLQLLCVQKVLLEASEKDKNK